MKENRKTETAPIKWNQAQTILKSLTADKNYNTALLFAAGFYFGLRIGDILRLRWEEILSDRFHLVEQKNGKRREIDVHKDFQNLALEAAAEASSSIDPAAFVFVDQRAGTRKDKPISVVAANKRIKKAFELYGIEAQNASSHTLRKTFGRRVYEKNHKSEAALILLSQIFNHRDLSTTRRYIGLTKERISNAYLSL